jgi:TonB family protein
MTTIPPAMDAARMWTYKPTLLNGAAVEVVTDIDLVYTPPKPEAAKPAGPPTGPKALPSKNDMPSFTPPTPLTKVEPDYSPEAHAAKLTTSVKVSLIVDEKGMPKDVKVYKSAGMGLDEKAVEAVKKWTFRPGTRDGKPVAVPAVVDVYFKSN